MAGMKNIFIAHVHEDDALLPKLKSLIGKSGMTVRDASINSEKPNDAKNKNYIKGLLSSRIEWASTVIVLISHATAQSEWVNWEIKRAIEKGKNVIGVYAQGATNADIPEELAKHAAAIVGWQSERIAEAINGDITGWDNPATESPQNSGVWSIVRYSCA